MKYIIVAILFIIAHTVSAADYTYGRGPRIESHSNDLLSRASNKSETSMLGAHFQLIVSSPPRSGKWLPTLPSFSLKIMHNPFFNSFDEKSDKTSFKLHWPIYRARDYELGFNYTYNRLNIPFELKQPYLDWKNSSVLNKQQNFNSKLLSSSAYMLLPDNKLINEFGLGVQGHRTTGEINNPIAKQNDYLATIKTQEWFVYIEHKARSLGWDMPFRMSLHQGQYSNNDHATRKLDDSILGANLAVGITYGYRINYKWTLRTDIAQKFQVRFNSAAKNTNYNKSWIHSQASAGISLYHHF